MDEVFGKKYVLTDSENFEDYLIFIGVNYFARKIALKLSQTHILTKNEDGTYTFQFISPMASTTVTFTSGVEFEEVKADGVKVKATMTIEDNIMTHIQIDENGKISTHVREFWPDKMTVTTTAKGLDKVVKRYYVVQQ
ncbi:probable fatty acid-binding protein [Helicoverpa zea]|uniref:probable fatty acid-binding protein n=1 Tax=Helicoverpa zea TaxID=7113 RepID=UPI001F568232|nr:probable fatty acid-binding protein [Helicoverpa zea]